MSDAAEAERRASYIAALRRADIAHPADVWLRYVVVSTCGVSLYLLTGRPFVLWWLAAFLGTSFVYLYLLWRRRAPVGRLTYTAFVVGNIVVTRIFAVMPLYLWSTDDTALRAVGICGLAGHAVFNISRHTDVGPVAIWDSLSMAAIISFFGGYEIARNMDGMPARLIIGLGTLVVVVYYLIAQWAVIRARERTTRAMQEAAQDSKIKAVGQLTSGISHDFNNLLTVIGGNIELAQITEDPRERRELLDQARAASDRAARLTSQLLSFSRKARLQATTFAVDDFLAQLQSTLARTLPASVEVRIEPGPAGLTLHCDRTLLESAMLNLAINARDAMEGRGRLAIDARGITDGRRGRQVRLTVRDTGPGIPPDVLGKVTEPFFTTKEVGKGSGLGLSMVSGFAEQSGGSLAIESAETGTVVRLRLPAGRPEMPGAA